MPTKNKPHYIAMSGTHGCIPDNIHVFEKRRYAVNYIIDIFELPVYGSRANDLRKTGYIDLGGEYGADYAEIQKCDCNNPEIHEE